MKSKFTREKAKIGRTVGSKIMAYNGYIEGINPVLVPENKIVQSWRGSDWPEGHFAKATFTRSGVPSDPFELIQDGWKEHYGDKMRAFLKKARGGH
jgi:hypothetical protein